jgi:hypothetical protein
MATEGRTRRIAPNPCRTYGRGFLWLATQRGSGASVKYDLLERVKYRSGSREF